MRDILKLLANGNFIILNRDLIKEIGLDETVLLAELCSEQYYWERKNKLGEDRFFYSTIDNVEKQIGFKKKKQLTLLTKLKTLNLIEVKYHDMPKKRYVRVNIAKLEVIQEKFSKKKDKTEIKLTESDYDIINTVVFEKDIPKELRKLFAEHILVLKQERNFEVCLKKVRGLANALKELEKYPIEEQKKFIKKSTLKKWSGYIYTDSKENTKKENNNANTKPTIEKKIIKEKTKEEKIDEDDGIFRDEDVDLTGIILDDDDGVFRDVDDDLTGEMLED